MRCRHEIFSLVDNRDSRCRCQLFHIYQMCNLYQSGMDERDGYPVGYRFTRFPPRNLDGDIINSVHLARALDIVQAIQRRGRLFN